MQQGYVDRLLHVVGQLVHRVGAQHDPLRAAGDQLRRGLSEQPGGLVPSSLLLERLDVSEVERPDQQVCRRDAPESIADELVDHAFVLD